MGRINRPPTPQEGPQNIQNGTGYHDLGSGKTFVRFGKALAEAMLELEKK